MKKFIFIFARTIVAFTIYAKQPDTSGTSSADEAHYAHILSCGKTIYVTHAYELSDQEVLDEIDALEAKYCN